VHGCLISTVWRQDKDRDPMLALADPGVKALSSAWLVGGGQVIRVSNHDRTTRWVTFHFDSEADAAAAHKLLEDALLKAVKVEWP